MPFSLSLSWDWRLGLETRSETKLRDKIRYKIKDTGKHDPSAMESLLDAFSPDLSGKSKRMGRRKGELFSTIRKELHSIEAAH